ncbi:hypothetical protein J22TS1_01580 [Siminovitchia terrae]|nr:hypothetical protein J22TS1_01580 [Siminovitchia terrae]
MRCDRMSRPEPADVQDVLVHAMRQDVAPEPADVQDVAFYYSRAPWGARIKPNSF